MAVAVLALLNGLVAAARRHRDHRLGAARPCSAAALVGFIAHQRARREPLMALGLFAHRNFALGSVVAFIYGMALFGSTYLVPVFMQIALNCRPVAGRRRAAAGRHRARADHPGRRPADRPAAVRPPGRARR